MLHCNNITFDLVDDKNNVTGKNGNQSTSTTKIVFVQVQKTVINWKTSLIIYVQSMNASKQHVLIKEVKTNNLLKWIYINFRNSK